MELQCGATRAVFDLDFGGRLASLCIDGTEVLVTERSGDTQWGCYPMIPWAGRVRDGRFVIEGRTHQLPLNLPPHALHGTVFGAQWSRHEDDTLQCPLGPSWPWLGDARSVVSLEADRLTWRVEVHAQDSTFPAVVGWHPWFLRKLADDSVGALSFEPQAMLSRDAAGIPTGECVPPTTGPWDDCFIGVATNPRLRWTNGLEVEISSTCSHWVVYDEPSHAICVEPQSGPPDAFNLGEAEAVRPGQPLVHTMTLRWRQTSRNQ